MEKIRVVVKEVGKPARLEMIPNELETYNKLVGGYIETFSLTDEILIVLNEEGKIQNLQPNLIIPCHGGQREIIVGNVVFVSMGDSDFAGLKDEHLLELENIGIEIEGLNIYDLKPENNK